MFSEYKRQYVHIALLLLAFSFKYLSKFQAVLLVAALLAVTIFIVPRAKSRFHFYRRTEQKLSQGALLYFLALLALVILFPLPIVAASWAILALGDGSATLFGQHFKARELPWNPHKTYVGSLSFIFFATIGATVLLRFMLPLSFGQSFIVALQASTVAALVESLPLRINDNVSVALTSAVALSILL